LIGNKIHRGMEAEDVTNLIEAHDWIAGLASRDCDCYLDASHSRVDNPCDVCQARKAMEALGRVIDPRPRTIHPERLTNPAEAVYFELWSEANKRSRNINGGYTLIEHLLCPSSQRDSFTKRAKPNDVSQHDMTIATTVIQWLGTNVGRCFIERAEAEIKNRNAIRREFDTDGLNYKPEAWKEMTENGRAHQIAYSIASNFISSESHKSAHIALVRAITNALLMFNKAEPQEQASQ